MEHTKISIIIAAHDQARDLEANLPSFLTTAREAGAEVIVVDDMSTDETPNVLKRMKTENADVLYTTFLPKSVVINPSRLRLALSIGTKAAKNDYIVLADINRPPVSLEWLTGLAESAAALVYSSRKGDIVKHVLATSLDDLHATILKAERKSGHGHRGKWQKRRRGLYDALSVKKECAHDAISLFDQDIRGFRLLGLRIRTWLGL
jgi:glycosyltransferase involved in cell wall biosynthesis